MPRSTEADDILQAECYEDIPGSVWTALSPTALYSLCSVHSGVVLPRNIGQLPRDTIDGHCYIPRLWLRLSAVLDG